MGWASGSYLAQDLYDDIRRYIPRSQRHHVAEKILAAFENHDADDWEQGSKLWKDARRPVEVYDG